MKAEDKAWLPRVTIASIIVVALLTLASWLQLRDIEQATLSVVANQQDGYVELVVGQIGLKDNRDDQEIISDILGVLDESASQYWTFSKGSTLLFVKDVAETNRYQGLPAGSYFEDEGTEGFYDGLEEGQVKHDFLTVGDSTYLASGEAFEYKGETYKLCLMTNESVILDNNQMLGARSRLAALLGIEAALLLVGAIFLARGRDKEREGRRAAEEEKLALDRRLESQNARIAREEVFNSGSRVWRSEALGHFIESLEKRGKTAVMASVSCRNGEDKDGMLGRAKVLFGEEVARFDGEGESFTLLFLDAGEDEARELIKDVIGTSEAEVTWQEVGQHEQA